MADWTSERLARALLRLDAFIQTSKRAGTFSANADVFALARIGFRIADSQGEVVEQLARTLCQTDHFHPIGPLDPDEMGPCKWDADCNEIAWQPNFMAYADQARAVIATLMEAAPCS